MYLKSLCFPLLHMTRFAVLSAAAKIHAVITRANVILVHRGVPGLVAVVEIAVAAPAANKAFMHIHLHEPC